MRDNCLCRQDILCSRESSMFQRVLSVPGPAWAKLARTAGTARTAGAAGPQGPPGQCVNSSVCLGPARAERARTTGAARTAGPARSARTARHVTLSQRTRRGGCRQLRLQFHHDRQAAKELFNVLSILRKKYQCVSILGPELEPKTFFLTNSPFIFPQPTIL
jgi:hypothetical protein